MFGLFVRFNLFSALEHKSEQPGQEQGKRTADQTRNSLTGIHSRFGLGSFGRLLGIFLFKTIIRQQGRFFLNIGQCGV